MTMTRKKLKTGNKYVTSIQCPVDLDSLIMSTDYTSESIEGELGVPEGMLWDAIRTSTCAYWLLKLDVMDGFSPEFRHKLYWCLNAFTRVNRTYFILQLEHSNHEKLKDEFREWSAANPIESTQRLSNPLNNLGNNTKDSDIKILNGKITLRKCLLDRIKSFLSTGNKDDVDFSYSLFLPELLNPKFFKDLSEAEHIVLLGNLDKYFKYFSQFDKMPVGLRGATHAASELNIPQHLVKHVLSGEVPYTNRVKMLAWRQLFKEIDRMYSSSRSDSMIFKVLGMDGVKDAVEKYEHNLKEKGYSMADVGTWLMNADGVFESFELDCTLHNLDATSFIVHLLCSRGYYKMAEGLVNFQDDQTRDKLFKYLSSMMLSCRGGLVA